MAKQTQKYTLETGPQCKAAIKEIERKTLWSLRRIAEESGINYETLRKVKEGFTKSPGATVRQAIADAVVRVRAMQ